MLQHQVFYLIKRFRYFSDYPMSHSVDVIRRVLLSPGVILQRYVASPNLRTLPQVHGDSLTSRDRQKIVPYLNIGRLVGRSVGR